MPHVRRLRVNARAIAILWVSLGIGAASAQAQQVTGSLVDRTTGAFRGEYDNLERAAARANQSVYNQLGGDAGCTNTACSDSDVLTIYVQAQELVHTANDLENNGGPTDESLGYSNDEPLGAALRWTAAEEVQAQARVATDFSNGQLTSAQSRITALRFGATGFSIAGLDGLPTREVPALAGTASLGPAGEGGEKLARFGGFLNGSYGWGAHDATTFEDAFDYESADVTLGVDYRILPELVIGLIGGYSQNEVNFDETKSVVDGGIDSEGFSVGAFGVYTWRDFYISGFLSYQRMAFDIDRFITYGSDNPDVDPTNTRTESDTDSNAYTASGNVGYTYRFGFGKSGFLSGKPLMLEPSFRAEYQNIRIAEYTEKNVDADRFAVDVEDQEIKSIELSLALRASIAISTPIGVFFPYVRGEWRFELEDSQREVSARYAGLGGLGFPVPFALDSEDIDTDYGVVTAGLQTIIRGGQSRVLGGPIGNRLSIFAEYRRVLELENVESELVNGGIRYLF